VLLGQNAPSNKLNIALIGAWGRGTAHFGVLSNENVAALCDVNELRLTEALRVFPKAQTYWTGASVSTRRGWTRVGDLHRGSPARIHRQLGAETAA